MFVHLSLEAGGWWATLTRNGQAVAAVGPFVDASQCLQEGAWWLSAFLGGI